MPQLFKVDILKMRKIKNSFSSISPIYLPNFVISMIPLDSTCLPVKYRRRGPKSLDCLETWKASELSFFLSFSGHFIYKCGGLKTQYLELFDRLAMANFLSNIKGFGDFNCQKCGLTLEIYLLALLAHKRRFGNCTRFAGILVTN